MSEYSTKKVGSKYTKSFKMYITKDNKIVSPFHDIPTFPEGASGRIINVVNEIPRFELAKFEISKSHGFNPIMQDTKKGELRFLKNLYPFFGYQSNYGAIPQTWENPRVKDARCGAFGDNDPVDVMEIGKRRKHTGQVYQAKVLGALALLDDGESDWKIIVIDVEDENAKDINNIEDAKRVFPRMLEDTLWWLKSYKVPEGKPENVFALDGNFVGPDVAMEVIRECHTHWETLMKDGHDGISLDNSTMPASKNYKADYALTDKAEPDGAIPEEAMVYHFYDATNESSCQDTATLLEGTHGYKYLGIVEDPTGVPKRDSFTKVKDELLARVRRLCATKLNARNLFHAINEHAISLVNYYVGVWNCGLEEFEELDKAVRRVLLEAHAHYQPASKARLYLPRRELGRGLHSVENRAELVLLGLRDALVKGSATSLRRAAIWCLEKDVKSPTALIREYLVARYNLPDPTEITRASLMDIQRASLYSEISSKTLHKKLYSTTKEPHVSVLDSSVWLRRGNISPREEAALCNLQDRNVFLGQTGKCPHCNASAKTVDHLATNCDRMLAHDYTRRHNEVVRSIHLLLCNKYGLKSSKKIRMHSVQEVVANRDVEIRVDTRVKTDVKVQHDRPDILIIDKKKKEAIIIEVGVTCQDRLKTVETEKLQKYDVLAGEISSLHGCRTFIIPYVVTWDGIVTNHHRRYVQQIGIPLNVESYIRTRVLKKTLESISLEARRSIFDEAGDAERLEKSLSRMLEGTSSMVATSGQ